MPTLPGMTNLVHLQLSGMPVRMHGRSKFYTGMVEQVCASCPQLRRLELMCQVQQADFDAVLDSQLTSFTCNSLSLVQDKSQSACSLEDLCAAPCVRALEKPDVPLLCRLGTSSRLPPP
jgi:hypothetical protein